MNRSFGTLGILAAAGLAGLASADIVSVSGTIDVVELGSNLSVHQFETNRIAAANEGELYLTEDVYVDITEVGAYTGEVMLTPGVLSAGQYVDSHILHVDPINGELFFNDGSVVFDGRILGIVVLTQSLRDSDPTGAEGGGVQYDQTNHWRGMELGKESPLDWITLAEDRRSITIHTGTDTALDEVRVFTQVPAPASCVMMIAGATCLGRRRRRSA